MDRVEDLGGGKGIKAAAYVRVSTKRQAKEGLSLEAQEMQLRELAQKMGVSRIYWFIDAGKSGKDFDRRKLNSILDLAERHEIEKLFVVDVDRLGRNSRKLLEFFCDLRDYGVTIQTPEGEIDIEKLEDLLISAIKAWAAQHDNERRAKASLSGKVRNFAKKQWKKPIRLGYQKRGDGWIEKKLDQEPVVKDVIGMFLTLRSYAAVKGAILKKHGLELTHQQIKRILQDPLYMGKPQCSGKAVIREFKSAVVVEDYALAYVDQETFEKVQKIIEQKHRRHSRRKTDTVKELLERYGVEVLDWIPNIAVLCPCCGQPMVRNGAIFVGGITARNYLCKKCGKQRRIPTKADIKRIRERSSGEEIRGEPDFKGHAKWGGKFRTIDEFFGSPSREQATEDGEGGESLQEERGHG